MITLTNNTRFIPTGDVQILTIDVTHVSLLCLNGITKTGFQSDVITKSIYAAINSALGDIPVVTKTHKVIKPSYMTDLDHRDVIIIPNSHDMRFMMYQKYPKDYRNFKTDELRWISKWGGITTTTTDNDIQLSKTDNGEIIGSRGIWPHENYLDFPDGERRYIFK